MKITEDSHLDHNLKPEHIKFIIDRFGSKQEFFKETVEMPKHLASLPSGLHGPLMGDEAIPSEECVEEARGDRGGSSRMCGRGTRPSRLLTVIGGPHKDEPCILYTAYGGPIAPREPWNAPEGPERDESTKFWSEHALSKPANDD